MKSILLIGLGRFGKHIAMHLNHLGHQVMAVDTSEERVEAVLPLVTNAQIGDSTNADFLESLGVRNYDVCIVAIGNNFQSSLETTSLLSELGARFVVSRAATDVQEKFLLRNGANEVASITGILVRERIPDSTFDQADQVELVDIEPAELLERLASGNVYREDQAQRATVNFFTLENLTALREIALRRCADRVNLLTESARVQSRGDYHTDEHILACLSSSPSNAKIIRTAARMARAFRGTFTALYVETPNTAAMSDDDKKRLQDNKRLAQQLGATIETSYGDDVPYQIAEFARLSGISKIVIGRSTIARKNIFSKPTLTERLISSVPNLDIHVIPDASAETSYQEKRVRRR